MSLPSPQILPIDPSRIDPAAIGIAVTALKSGGLVVLPTETVYGLAADPRQRHAVQQLYDTKGRPAEKPIALMAAGVEEVRASGVEWSALTDRLARACWPGPLTLVLKQGDEWTGYRIPDHPIALELLRAWGTLLAVTSANLSGQPPACDAAAAIALVGGRTAVVLDGGPAMGGVASTVVRVSGDKMEILRPGALDEQTLLRIAAASK